MKLEELRQAWRSQDTRITVRTVLLLDSIRERQKHNNRVIWLRNIREGWGSILAAVFLSCSFASDVESRLQLWPFYSAMTILFGIGVFRVIDNRRQKRRGLQYGDGSLSFVKCSLQNINHRIWLLENVFWWWILPVVVGGILVIAQVVMLVGLQEPTLLCKLGLAAGIGCVILGILYWGNRWTAQKYWLPRKTELETIISALTTR